MRVLAAAAVAVAVVSAGCGGGGDDDDASDAGDKITRQGAVAAMAGDVMWVIGGTEGRAEEMLTGEAFGPGSTWAPRTDAVGYDADGEEVVRVALGDDVLAVDPAVVEVGGRTLLVGGACPPAPFNCGGPTTPLVGWLDGDELESVELAGIAGVRSAELAGVTGSVAWLLVDDEVDSRLLRLDAATGVAEVVDAPEGIWTGDVCAGPDAVVAAVSELDEGFVAVALHLWTRPIEPAGAPWTLTGTVPMGDRAPTAVRLHCAGDGEVVVDLRDLGAPLVLRVDDATPVDATADVGGGEVIVASDPLGGLVAVTVWDQVDPAPVLVYGPGEGWVEVDRFRASTTAPPALAVTGGRVFEVGGAALVEGVGPRPLG